MQRKMKKNPNEGKKIKTDETRRNKREGTRWKQETAKQIFDEIIT